MRCGKNNGTGEFGIPSPPIVGNGMEVRLIKH